MNSARYTRQTILKEFGPEGQKKLADAKVLVIGAGGLGVPVLTYLNAMGVGTLGIVDNDKVSVTNLHRQVLYGDADVGRSKVSVALNRLKAQNPDTELRGHETFLNVENALELIGAYDVVVDTSDNFPTRYLTNDACVILKKPFVYGALHGYEGQVSVFNCQGGPTYRCLFPTMPKENEVPNCNEHGVLGIIPGIVGNLQALETVKLITGLGELLSGRLLLFDGLRQSYQKISFPLRPTNLKVTRLQDSYGWEDSCATVPNITVDALQEVLEKGGNAQIIDVRTPAEYEAYHLPNTIHIPLDELDGALRGIDLDASVYLLCQSGKRSDMAALKLQPQYSETKFYSILGGVNQFLATCS